MCGSVESGCRLLYIFGKEQQGSIAAGNKTEAGYEVLDGDRTEFDLT